jgi:predicted NUDIX family NTP pyrophosphohydrolase
MKKLTRAQLFAPVQRGPRKTKDWFERARLVVAAARDRAVEMAQQRRAPSMKRFPTVLRGAAWLSGWRQNFATGEFF